MEFGEVAGLDNAGLGHFDPEVVALAGALAHAGEHREAAVVLGDVVDEFHDDDGLADAGAAEEADLAALQKGLDEIDDLDAGLEHLFAGGLLVEERRGPVNGHARLLADGAEFVHRLADHVDARGPASLCPRARVIGPPRSMAFMPRTMPSVASMATVRTRPSPRCCCTSRMTLMGVGTVKPSLVTRSAW